MMAEELQLAFERFFEDALSRGVDAEAIWENWNRLQPPYAVKQRRPPAPLWERRRFTETGENAWKTVQQELGANAAERGYCVYVHIPFCAEKCPFCDCYSFRLKSNHEKQAEAYRAALVQEVRLWSQAGGLSRRQISTVHFGGGTPLHIGERVFRQIVEGIAGMLNAGPEVEWALETTSSALGEDGQELLEQLGFKRIHVGVQTLDDPLRSLLKRGEAGEMVLEKIRESIRRGGVVSVDLIYGLPQQSLKSLVDDIHLLAENGVDGFSLYPLQISSRNRGMLAYYGSRGKDLLDEFWMLQAAEQVLQALGYRKTLFNHYARQKDTNLYFTFPERGEDCLAVGTIADGVFGSYHYRHPEYPEYLAGVSEAFPGLQGGLRRSPAKERVRPLEVMILSGRLRREVFERVLGMPQTETLFHRWLTAALIGPGGGGEFMLTASGSWFAGAMINELND
jgi:coproporphyrinogen III oxidase-like Fe-S oxidoreductase